MRGTSHYPSPVRRRLVCAFASLIVAVAIGACGGDDAAEGEGQSTSGSAKDSAGSYRLAAGGRALIGPSGERVAIDPKRVTGYVDAAQETGSYLDMSGWAAPADLSSPADAIVAIVGTKSVATTKPTRTRSDLVDGYNRPGLEKAGFVFSFPKSALRCSEPNGGLKTFAVAKGAAAPMKWLADVGERVKSTC